MLKPKHALSTWVDWSIRSNHARSRCSGLPPFKLRLKIKATIPPLQVGGRKKKPPKRWQKLIFLSFGILFLSIGLFLFAVLYPKITAPVYAVVSLVCFSIFTYLHYKEKRLTRLVSGCPKANKYDTDNSGDYGNISKTSAITRMRTKEITDIGYTNSEETSHNSNQAKNSKQKNKTTNNKKQQFHNMPPRGES